MESGGGRRLAVRFAMVVTVEGVFAMVCGGLFASLAGVRVDFPRVDLFAMSGQQDPSVAEDSGFCTLVSSSPRGNLFPLIVSVSVAIFHVSPHPRQGAFEMHATSSVSPAEVTDIVEFTDELVGKVREPLSIDMIREERFDPFGVCRNTNP